ncbi:hypothetical protein AHMF7605_23110 [Adhaeribacter arboris]|uniref:Lipocalin-like domain-containing protein n=1 Tax=Adhaeribacter arboris TaxID=2072846 RepID=A0A2T2YL44_9BACT|nr:hypothetical protein [Adhaeribacter arboris]PSR56185.1 hypothetical protein AHMF7605_23110 [Adhaeribacter arboris]
MPERKIDNTLTGTWELRSVVGGLMVHPKYTPGNGNILKFEDTNYSKYSNGQLTKNGTYTLISGKSFNGELMERIIYDDDDINASMQFLEIRNGKLTIYWGADISLDGAVMQYEKL